MLTATNHTASYRLGEETAELDQFEPIRHPQYGGCPVGAHGARLKARMRSRGGAAARRKGASFNGPHRRRRRQWRDSQAA
jgi:hypothetical protein